MEELEARSPQAVPRPFQDELLQLELPHDMVRLPTTFIFNLPNRSSFPKSFTYHPRRPPPWMGSSFKHYMHGTSITYRSFPTSLVSHRNKPHSIWSLDAPGIISNVFTPELFIVLPDGPLFSQTVHRRQCSFQRKAPRA
jgi:hypothetical protein